MAKSDTVDGSKVLVIEILTDPKTKQKEAYHFTERMLDLLIDKVSPDAELMQQIQIYSIDTEERIRNGQRGSTEVRPYTEKFRDYIAETCGKVLMDAMSTKIINVVEEELAESGLIRWNLENGGNS